MTPEALHHSILIELRGHRPSRQLWSPSPVLIVEYAEWRSTREEQTAADQLAPYEGVCDQLHYLKLNELMEKDKCVTRQMDELCRRLMGGLIGEFLVKNIRIYGKLQEKTSDKHLAVQFCRKFNIELVLRTSSLNIFHSCAVLRIWDKISFDFLY